MSDQNQLVSGNWNQRNDELFDNSVNHPNWITPSGMVNNRANQLLRSTKQELTPFAPILNADLVETPNEFHVQTDLPGVLAEDLDVSIYGRNLIIKAERQHSFNIDNDYYHRRERTFGKVQRTIPIPVNADTDKSSVNFKNGVLNIVFPKGDKGSYQRKLRITEN